MSRTTGAAQVRNMGVIEGNRPATDNGWEEVKRRWRCSHQALDHGADVRAVMYGRPRGCQHGQPQVDQLRDCRVLEPKHRRRWHSHSRVAGQRRSHGYEWRKVVVAPNDRNTIPSWMSRGRASMGALRRIPATHSTALKDSDVEHIVAWARPGAPVCRARMRRLRQRSGQHHGRAPSTEPAAEVHKDIADWQPPKNVCWFATQVNESG